LTVEEVLKGYPHPDYLKLLFLKTHYRSPLDYSTQRMDEAKKNWEEFARFFQRSLQAGVQSVKSGQAGDDAEIQRRQFEAAMEDDLNTPAALAALFELVNLGQRLLDQPDRSNRPQVKFIYDTLLDCGGTLGLFRQGLAEETPDVLAKVQTRISERDAARKAKDFTAADAIRRDLQEQGYQLMDTPGGTFWHRSR